MRINYVPKRFSRQSLYLIEKANEIINEYTEQGFILTLRQLYYQFISRDIMPNNVNSYKNLGNIINDGRMSGRISWEAIEDRTRNLVRNTHWNSPKEILEIAEKQYSLNLWDNQRYRPEVWVEKEALTGVIDGICRELDVPYFACRGYNSQSEQWKAGRRFKHYIENNQIPIIFHLGDHDPSGIDMTRDIIDRISLFADSTIEVTRLALNMDQIEEYTPPPNPAKTTDTRFESYRGIYGEDSWELDALEPNMIVGLIRNNVEQLIDYKNLNKTLRKQKSDKSKLKRIIKNI